MYTLIETTIDSSNPLDITNEVLGLDSLPIIQAMYTKYLNHDITNRYESPQFISNTETQTIFQSDDTNICIQICEPPQHINLDTKSDPSIDNSFLDNSSNDTAPLSSMSNEEIDDYLTNLAKIIASTPKIPVGKQPTLTVSFK